MPTGASTEQQQDEPVAYTLKFSPEAYAFLAKLAEYEGKSVVQFVEGAIALEHRAQQVWAQGGKLLFERKGRVTEFVRDF